MAEKSGIVVANSTVCHGFSGFWGCCDKILFRVHPIRMIETYIAEEQVPRLLEALEAEYETILFAPDAIIPYRQLSDEDKRHLPLREPRSSFSPKSFLLPAKERLAEYGTGVKDRGQSPAVPAAKPPALVNVRNCDLEAMVVLDQIFLEGDYVDPYYAQRRQAMLVVSVDCASITEFCFCQTLGYQPFVKQGRGINLSPVEGGYVARADTPAGEKVLQQFQSSPPAVENRHKEQVEQCHQATLALLQQSNEKFTTRQSFYEILKANPPSEKWNDLFNRCVECAACTNVCPSCYCFYMFDQKRMPDRQDVFERLRSWDSCLLADYSRMAGVGGVKPSPRPQIRARYANRFNHKYLYHYETYGRYGCTGCGRCSQSCMATTDPREVMRVLGQ